MADNPKTYRISVAGVNKRDTGSRWQSASNYPGGVCVEREPSNRYDRNAVALRFFGEVIGYLSRYMAKQVAPLLDDGWSASIKDIDVDLLPGRKRVKDDFGDWYYEEDWDDEHYGVMATLILEPPASVVGDKRQDQAPEPTFPDWPANAHPEQTSLRFDDLA